MLVIESASLMGLMRMDDAKRTLKKALHKIDINGEDGEMYVSGITSMLVMNDYMANQYKIYRLSSTRELVYKNKKIEKGKGVVVYGGLLYDMSAADLEKDKSNYKMIYRGDFGLSKSNKRDLRAAVTSIPFLEGTREEVDRIEEIVKKVGAEVVTSMKGVKGTETSFKALSESGKKVIHIATHGFYWENKMNESNMGAFFHDSRMEDKVLTRSGLFFSGANNAFFGETLPEGVDDGILTAKEIACMDLKGTDLVVLSACETGLGDITGDGVFGLQRGFKKAGVQSIVMSLWKVDDEATRLLMVEFYTNLVVRKQSKLQALVNAQHYLRTYGDGRYAHPRYWAAFILLDGID